MTSRSYVLVAIFSIFAVIPLLKPEFFASHDMLAPVYRLLELDTCIKGGVPFVRWFPDLYGGRGGPFFNYYAPFSYYVAEVFHLAGLGYLSSIKASFLSSFVLSGVFMYMFARDKVGEYPAVLAGVLYVYAPYHLYDVYVRGALAESFAFVFFPLVLYALGRGYVVLSAVSYALLILTHNVSALLFTGFLVFYVALFRKELSLKKVALALLFGLLLSAFYWIPALFEKHMVNIENILVFAPKDNSLGVYDILGKIGFIPFFLALSALVLSKERHTRIFGVIFFVLIFFMTPYSAIFWNLPLAAYVQFPWRLLAIAALIVSLLGGIAVSSVGHRRILMLSGLVIISSFSLIGYSEHIDVSEGDITRQELKNLNTGLTYGLEYLPGNAKMLDPTVKDKVELVSGQGLLGITEESCNSLAFEYEGGEALVRVNTYYFPGWTAYVDGKRVVSQTDGSGLIVLDVPKGSHEILLAFEDTPVRQVSEILSLFAFTVLSLQTVRAYRAASRPRRRREAQN